MKGNQAELHLLAQRLYVTFNTMRPISYNGNRFAKKALKSLKLRTQYVQDKWSLCFCNVPVTGPSQ